MFVFVSRRVSFRLRRVFSKNRAVLHNWTGRKYVLHVQEFCGWIKQQISFTSSNLNVSDLDCIDSRFDTSSYFDFRSRHVDWSMILKHPVWISHFSLWLDIAVVFVTAKKQFALRAVLVLMLNAVKENSTTYILKFLLSSFEFELSWVVTPCHLKNLWWIKRLLPTWDEPIQINSDFSLLTYWKLTTPITIAKQKRKKKGMAIADHYSTNFISMNFCTGGFHKQTQNLQTRYMIKRLNVDPRCITDCIADLQPLFFTSLVLMCA